MTKDKFICFYTFYSSKNNGLDSKNVAVINPSQQGVNETWFAQGSDIEEAATAVIKNIRKKNKHSHVAMNENEPMAQVGLDAILIPEDILFADIAEPIEWDRIQHVSLHKS